MSYNRVIPRDLFNEASLLKCYGALYLALEIEFGHSAKLVDNAGQDESFKVGFSPSSGSIFLENVWLEIGGKRFEMWRPLNSREDWPLYCSAEPECGEGMGGEVEVFGDVGQLSPDFLKLIKS